MKPAINCFFVILVILILSQSSQALIVWDGKIVDAWPQEVHQVVLGKRAASSDSEPYGFFPRPRDTTYGVVMIVDFSDQEAKFTKEQVEEWLNKTGYSSTHANGSVHDYYYQISNEKFSLFNDVFGYYRAKQPKSYYENSSGYEKASELVNEMLTYFDPVIDFSKYDNDKNGTTESISFVYAGAGKNWGKGLWPHSGWINKKKDGVTLGTYNMSDMGSGLGLYVFCHETGHMIFGWPDLYWFGDYCIMGNRMSDNNPVPVNDFFRADQGWIPTTTISGTDNARYTVAPGQMVYRYINPTNKKQMYLWSFIQNTGRYSTLKGKGLLVFKFDNSIRGNSSGTSRQLYIVEADGNNAMAEEQWPNPGSAATDFYYSTYKSEFSSTTKPASLWGLKIYNISPVADSMTFYVGTGTVPAHGGLCLLPVTNASEKMPRSLFNLKGQRVGRATVSESADILQSNGFYIMKNLQNVQQSIIIH